MKSVPTTPPRKILVIRLQGVGDVILATPTVRALRKSFPEAQIHFLTYPINEPLLRHNPHLDRIILHPKKKAPLLDKIRLIRGLRRERYDWVIDLAATPRTAWLTLFTGAPVRVGYAFRVRKWAFTFRVPKNQVRRFQADVCLTLIRHLGVADDGLQTEIMLGGEEKDWAKAYFENPAVAAPRWKIALNPTGAWTAKQWPVTRWRELIPLLNKSLGIKPILFWGPGSEKLVQDITHGLEDQIILMPDSNLLQAGAFIARLDLLIGTDGTPQHMAQALGTRSLTLWGPGWGIGWTLPNDPRHRALQHFLDCGPCDKMVCPFPERTDGPAGFPPPGSPHYQRECLDRITPEEVLAAAKEMLGIS